MSEGTNYELIIIGSVVGGFFIVLLLVLTGCITIKLTHGPMRKPTYFLDRHSPTYHDQPYSVFHSETSGRGQYMRASRPISARWAQFDR